MLVLTRRKVRIDLMLSDMIQTDISSGSRTAIDHNWSQPWRYIDQTGVFAVLLGNIADV